MKNRMAMYEISIKIVFLFCMFYNIVFKRISFFTCGIYNCNYLDSVLVIVLGRIIMSQILT
jgi:hypothetical protein